MKLGNLELTAKIQEEKLRQGEENESGLSVECQLNLNNINIMYISSYCIIS